MDNKSNQVYPPCSPFFFYVTAIFLTSSMCMGQDKIYLENEQRNGKVIEITPEKVKYKNPANPGPVYSVTRSKVKLLFNENGGFLVLKGLGSADAKRDETLINNFINPAVHNPDALDKIFNIQNKQIDCTILNEDETSYTITYNDLDVTYAKSLVAAIIYKDGKHKIVSDITIAIEVLDNLQKEKNSKIVAAKKDAVVKKSSPLNINKETPLEGTIYKDSKANEADQSLKEELAITDKEEKTLVAAQKKAKADSIADRNALNKKYNQILAKAKSFYDKGEYENAKIEYSLAASLKPDEEAPANVLALINEKLADSIQYELLRDIADSLFSVDKPGAVDAYQKILELKPSDHYALRQVNYLQKTIVEEKRLDEKRKKEELEKRYQSALDKGKVAGKEKKYEEALAAYKEALGIHPENEDIKQWINIMENQVNLVKKASDK